MKELKALLPLINYKAPSSRILKDKFQVLLVICFTTTIFLHVTSYKTSALVQPVHLATCHRMNPFVSMLLFSAFFRRK